MVGQDWIHDCALARSEVTRFIPRWASSDGGSSCFSLVGVTGQDSGLFSGWDSHCGGGL